MKTIVRTLLFIFIVGDLHAQDSLKISKFRSDFLAPTALVAAGLIAVTDNEVFDKWEVYEAREKSFPNFHTSIDNYLQFAPIVAAYALDAFKVKGTHRVGPKTILLLKSEVIMVAITFPMKHLIGTPRPDTGTKNSFPSGHTAQAFAAATFFHKEYGHISRWYSIGAYTVAGTVGVLRVLNDRHWASDVLVGAGIGILSTNLAYMTERRSKHTAHRVMHGLSVIPSYARGSFGATMIVKVGRS